VPSPSHLSAGADVVVSYLSEDGYASETAHWIEREERRAFVHPGYIASEEHCGYLVC